MATTGILIPAASGAAAPAARLLPSQQAHASGEHAPLPEAEGDAPLVVTIGSLSPSTIPRRGPITVTGTVSNRDDAPWSAIDLYPFVSASPMTTRAELTEAAATAPEQPVGDRITGRGPLDSIAQLAPGETASYTLRIPRGDLQVTQPGVYWFGVHALGETVDETRDDAFADGRARTLLPLVPAAGEPVATALVIPLRQGIRYRSDGSLDDVQRWASSLGPGGRLRSLLDLGATAGDRPVSWLVDPALLDAVERLAAGNRPRSLAPTLDPEATEDPDLAVEPDSSESPGDGTDPSASPSAESEAPAPEAEETEEPDPATLAAASAAEGWLSRWRDVAGGGGQVLALPYGDLDVAAAADHGPDFYERARRRSSQVMERWGVPAAPAIGAPTGNLDVPALELAAGSDTVLVGDKLFENEVPTVSSVLGQRVVVASSDAASGGPGPDDRLAPVALRQRILAEAAVRRLRPGRQPLVVVLPGSWTPTPSMSFFDGLDVPWTRLATVAGATSSPATEVDLDTVAYPASETERELRADSFAAARELIRAGIALQNLLTRNDRVAGLIADQALTGLSYASRGNQAAARLRALRARGWIQGRLSRVDIEAPPQVTMSSATGRFSATITNHLDQAVTVRIDAVADQPIRIEAPTLIEIGPDSSRTVLLTASTERQGVHNVTLLLTDADGTPLGPRAELPIRTALVSGVIWLIIGVGCALLFGAIAVRLVRRVRRARQRSRGVTG